VLASLDGGHRCDGVNVVGCADRDRVNVPRFFVEHLAKIFVSPRLWMRIECPCRPGLVDIAQRHVIRTEFSDRRDVPASHATATNASDVEPLAWRCLPLPAKNMSRDNGEAECRCCGRRKKFPARDLLAGFDISY
jgi:hypothetical protein